MLHRHSTFFYHSSQPLENEMLLVGGRVQPAGGYDRYLWKAHFHMVFQFGFFPYIRMPVR